MAMSVAHRATGMALYGGTLLVAAWLIAAASGKGAYEWAQWIAGSPLGLIVLFGYSFVLFHHMVGGLRHFIWDFGYGFDAQQRMNLARMTPFVAGALTLVVWIAGLALR